MKAYLLVNFGGPRNLNEVAPFLKSLLNDEEVIWPKIPRFFHHAFFTYVAWKRAKTVIHDYQKIGNKSPIFEDTENLAKILSKKLDAPVITFHRYLVSTHNKTWQLLENFQQVAALPLFPQFSYATTGSSARFFEKIGTKLRWIKSYPTHLKFINLWQQNIQNFLKEHNLQEEDSFFVFSAHGLPEVFIQSGDPYEKEVTETVNCVIKAFPKAKYKLAYQSEFGREKWIGPSTKMICRNITDWSEGRSNIIFIPISFTSDHIETLFEIEYGYMPIIEATGLKPFRVPAPFYHDSFADAMIEILQETDLYETKELVRRLAK